MSQLDEVCHDGLRDRRGIARDDAGRIKLPGSSGREQFRFIGAWKHEAFKLVSADVLHHRDKGSIDLLCLLVVFIVYLQLVRYIDDRKAGQITFNADCLNLLHAALKIPASVCIAQD